VPEGLVLRPSGAPFHARRCGDVAFRRSLVGVTWLTCLGMVAGLATGSLRAPLVQRRAGPPARLFHAWLEVPGGELPFELELERRGDRWAARIRNGPETLDVPTVTASDDERTLTLAFPHYDATIVATFDERGALVGEWTKRRGLERWSRVPFGARPGLEPRFPDRGPSSRPAPEGRFAVDFESSDDPAVGRFEIDADGRARGTFLTTLGDYRWLAGRWHGDVLELSCFDGAHAFLFRARAREDGALHGDFWSSDTWHETWTARPDDDARLPDPFAQVRWTSERSVYELAFPDADASNDEPRPLAEFRGHPLVVQIFGTWCPNCCDETRFLAELDARFSERGLRIVGLAFEHTGDLERDRRQIARWRGRFGARYPVLLAGVSDKERATAALGALDRIKSFPTTVFVDREGSVRAVHSGFAGPATGAAHDRLRERFEALILELLDES